MTSPKKTNPSCWESLVSKLDTLRDEIIEENDTQVMFVCYVKHLSREYRTLCYIAVNELTEEEINFLEKFFQKCEDEDILDDWNYTYETKLLKKWAAVDLFSEDSSIRYEHEEPHKANIEQIRAWKLHEKVLDELDVDEFENILINQHSCVIDAMTRFFK